MKIKLKHTILIGNIGANVSEEAVRDLFATAGLEVAGVTIPVGRLVGSNRGYVLVDMQSSAHADQALTDLAGSLLDGRIISLSREDSVEPPKKKWYQLNKSVFS
jgi:RNA recognition motif-containing protein